MLRTTFALLALVSFQTAAYADVPGLGAVEIRVGAPDPLVAEALQFLDSQQKRLDKGFEHLISANKLSPEEMPDPQIVPSGTLQLRLSRQEVVMHTTVIAHAEWSVQVPEAADRQFTLNMHLAHFVGSQYYGGGGSGGLAMSRFNGNTSRLQTNAPVHLPGIHRVLGVLSARSIKSRDVYILSVVELPYLVAKP